MHHVYWLCTIYRWSCLTQSSARLELTAGSGVCDKSFTWYTVYETRMHIQFVPYRLAGTSINTRTLMMRACLPSRSHGADFRDIVRKHLMCLKRPGPRFGLDICKCWNVPRSCHVHFAA